jgi:hypothetical protein
MDVDSFQKSGEILRKDTSECLMMLSSRFFACALADCSPKDTLERLDSEGFFSRIEDLVNLADSQGDKDRLFILGTLKREIDSLLIKKNSTDEVSGASLETLKKGIRDLTLNTRLALAGLSATK